MGANEYITTQVIQSKVSFESRDLYHPIPPSVKEGAFDTWLGQNLHFLAVFLLNNNSYNLYVYSLLLNNKLR